jgi:hypothetical protein
MDENNKNNMQNEQFASAETVEVGASESADLSKEFKNSSGEKKSGGMLLTIIVLIVVLGGAWYMLTRSGGTDTTEGDGATLEISPSSGGYMVGDTWTADIILDTSGADVDGVDILIKYDTSLLDAVNDSVDISGSPLPVTPANTIDDGVGEISFSALSNGGESFRGREKLGSVSFRSIAAGRASVEFVFSAGVTTDSNVASAGVDILTSVNKALYDITVPTAQN